MSTATTASTPTTTSTTSTAPAEVYYPGSDGEPMGETGFHIRASMYLYQALRDRFAARTDVYVTANMFIYYEEGNSHKRRAPDCMVIFGAGNHERRIFQTWVEGVVPAVIFELSSHETFREDFGAKLELYARLGVPEYYIFDPGGDCLDEPLYGYRLEGSEYATMPLEPDGGLTSPTLGLRIVPEGALPRLIDARTHQPLLGSWEQAATIEEQASTIEEQTSTIEEQAASLERVSERVSALEAELERLRMQDRPS